MVVVVVVVVVAFAAVVASSRDIASGSGCSSIAASAEGRGLRR